MAPRNGLKVAILHGNDNEKGLLPTMWITVQLILPGNAVVVVVVLVLANGGREKTLHRDVPATKEKREEREVDGGT